MRLQLKKKKQRKPIDYSSPKHQRDLGQAEIGVEQPEPRFPKITFDNNTQPDRAGWDLVLHNIMYNLNPMSRELNYKAFLTTFDIDAVCAEGEYFVKKQFQTNLQQLKEKESIIRDDEEKMALKTQFLLGAIGLNTVSPQLSHHSPAARKKTKSTNVLKPRNSVVAGNFCPIIRKPALSGSSIGNEHKDNFDFFLCVKQHQDDFERLRSKNVRSGKL